MATLNEIIANRAATYKKRVAGAFVLVDGAKFTSKVMGSDFCVTKKIDGSMQLLFFDNGEVKSVSRGGTILETLPLLACVSECVKDAGIDEAVFAAELYVKHPNGQRERVGDVSTALAEKSDKLCYAPFDILEIDGKQWEATHYRDTLNELNRIFDSCECVKPVVARYTSSKDELAEIYREWVVDGGAEGIVVHSEVPIVYKVKPSHTFDAAVLGFTTTDDDPRQVRSLLFGMMREDGLWQLIGTSGMGLTVQLRKGLFKRLHEKSVETEYIVTDSRGIAYRFVQPELVVELSAIDLVTDNAVGEPKMNPLVAYNPEKGYLAKGLTSGVSVLAMVIEKIRDDKQPDATDVRLSQITDLVEFVKGCNEPIEELPKSEILVRRVYTKGAGAKLMVHKFIVFKTNKEHTGKYPAYVLHHTDFSCGRKEPLKRDLRVSSSRDQIFALLDEFITENIKKGWKEVTNS